MYFSYAFDDQRFPDGNLFIHFDASNLTRYQFSYILQKSLNFCEEKGLYKPHSFTANTKIPFQAFYGANQFVNLSPYD
jgi:hypothetical protein